LPPSPWWASAAASVSSWPDSGAASANLFE
jgi:hypothetical protein